MSSSVLFLWIKSNIKKLNLSWFIVVRSHFYSNFKVNAELSLTALVAGAIIKIFRSITISEKKLRLTGCNPFMYFIMQRFLFDDSVIRGSSSLHRFSGLLKFPFPLLFQKVKSRRVKNWAFCKTWWNICLPFALFLMCMFENSAATKSRWYSNVSWLVNASRLFFLSFQILFQQRLDPYYLKTCFNSSVCYSSYIYNK